MVNPPFPDHSRYPPQCCRLLSLSQSTSRATIHFSTAPGSARDLGAHCASSGEQSRFRWQLPALPRSFRAAVFLSGARPPAGAHPPYSSIRRCIAVVSKMSGVMAAPQKGGTRREGGSHLDNAQILRSK
jgi:hypothetical protein